MAVAITLPDGPVLVRLDEEPFALFSRVWDPRNRRVGVLRDEDLTGQTVEERENAVAEILAASCDVCADRIGALRDSDASMDGDEELENWELELNTWRLCEYLLPQRLLGNPPQAEPSNIYASDSKLVADYIGSNTDLSEAVLVRRWLEDTAPDFDAVEVRKGYQPHTFKALKDRQRLNLPDDKLVQELDPDAPLRTQRALDIGDKEYEDQLCRTLYSYIRRGKADDAVHLCEESSQPWRAASIAGGMLHVDEVMDDDVDPDDTLDGFGNMNRDLWKACAYRIACEEQFTLYERALYAALCGDLRNALPACQNWEDYLWTFYVVLLESRTAEHLSTIPHVDGPENQETGFAEAGLEGPPLVRLGADDIFRHIEAMHYDFVRRAVRNPFHRIQKMIILDRVHELVKDVRKELEDDANAADASRATLFKHPHCLRALTHVIILYRTAGLGGISPDDANFIIKTYVDMFMSINAQPPAVLAPYIAELPGLNQILCFATLLHRLKTTQHQKAELLRLASEYNMDRFAIAAKTVELIVDGDGAGSMDPEEPMDKESRQIDSIGWLTVDKELYPQAALRSHQLARRFLSDHRLAATKVLLESLPENLVSQQILSDISNSTNFRAELQGLGSFEQRLEIDLALERLFLRQLVAALEDYASWTRAMLRKPLPLDGEVRETRGRRNDASARKRDYLAWEKEVRDLSVQVTKQLEELLSIGFFTDRDWSSGLAELELFEGILNERAALRDIYVPEIVFCLHNVYFETRDLEAGNLVKSIELATKVGDHTKGIFETLVRTDKAASFLQLARKSCLEYLARSGSPFPDTRPPLLSNV
ncbi:nuclear pore protein 84/107 [Hyaloraphidium curvatum]|nr:nuclear pore protein 84/107 [Hyaloraphidium curvatum]